MAAGDVEVDFTNPNAKIGAYFDGVDDKITISGDALPDVPFTISFWEWSRDTNIGYFLCDEIDVDNLFFRRSDGGLKVGGSLGDTTINEKTTNNEQWNHIVLKTDGTTSQIWINGVKEITTGANNFAGMTNNLMLGNRNDLTRDFKGMISEFRIYNRQLTDDEIIAIYNGDITRTGLTHEYLFNTDYNDSVGNLNGTNSGTRLAIFDSDMAAKIKADRTGINDHYMIATTGKNQIISTIVEE